MASISLYIPCFNGAAHLRKTLSAALAQTRPADEVLVVDDGSTDNSREIATEFPVTILAHPRNQGLGAARNSALHRASGDLLAALDADVAAEPEWLARMEAALERGNVSGTGGRMIEEFQDSLADRWRAHIMRQHHGEQPGQNLLIFGCNSLYSREALLAIGGYDERCLGSFEDYNLWTRLRAAGAQTAYVPDAVCRHQRRDSIDSVLDACYSWRRPGYERSGSFESVQALSAKWTVSTNADLEIITGLVREGRAELAQLSLLGMFRHLYKDAQLLLDRHPEAEPDLLQCAAGIIAVLILDATSDFPVLRRVLTDDIDRFMGKSPHPGAISVFREVPRRQSAGLADEILRGAGVRDSAALTPLFIVMPWLSAEIRAIRDALAALDAAPWEELIAERDRGA